MKTHRERAEEIVGRYPRGGPLKPSAREIADGTYPTELVAAAWRMLDAVNPEPGVVAAPRMADVEIFRAALALYEDADDA